MIKQDTTINIFLLRHGATAGNKEYRYIGWTDEPLSEDGINQIRKRFDAAWSVGIDPVQTPDLLSVSPLTLCQQTPDLLVVSPMTRCRQTAALIWPDQPQTIVENLKEMNFGHFEGKNYHDLNGDPDYQAWIDSNGTIAFPEGEDRAGFIGRSMQGYEQMLQAAQKLEPVWKYKLSYGDAPSDVNTECPLHRISIAAVVHGGTIMAILSSLTGEDYFSFQVRNGEGYLLKFLLENQGALSHEAGILNELKLLEYRKI